MLIAFNGYIDDGARPIGASTPADHRRVLRLQQGVDTIVRVTLKSVCGVEIALPAGGKLVLSARSQTTPAKRLFVKNSTPAPTVARNAHEFTITAADTRAVAVTRGVWDLFAVYSGSKHIIVPSSQLIIARSVADASSLTE